MKNKNLLYAFTFMILVCTMLYCSKRERNNSENNIQAECSANILIIAPTYLYKDESGLKEVRKMNFLEGVKLLEDKEKSNKIKVVTSEGETGWIERSNSSIHGREWRPFNMINELSFQLPLDLKYKFVRGKDGSQNIGHTGIVVEHHLFTKDREYFIIVRRINVDLNNFKQKYNYKLSFCVNNNYGFYMMSEEQDGSIAHEIIFKGKLNDMYQIIIFTDNSKMKSDLVKKILFSTKLK